MKSNQIKSHCAQKATKHRLNASQLNSIGQQEIVVFTSFD